MEETAEGEIEKKIDECIIRIESLTKWNEWFVQNVKNMRHYQTLYRQRYRRMDAAEWRKKMWEAEKIVDEELRKLTG